MKRLTIRSEALDCVPGGPAPPIGALGLLCFLAVSALLPGSFPSAVSAQTGGPGSVIDLPPRATPSTPTLVVPSQPELVLGLIDGPEEYLFGSVVHAEFLPDGRIAVGDDVARTIRVFLPDGTFDRSVGRSGGGPGEFGRLGRFATRADGRLVVWDPSRVTVTVFGSDGSHESDWRALTCIEFEANGLIQRDQTCRRPPMGFPTTRMVAFESPAGRYGPDHDLQNGEVEIHDSLTVAVIAVSPDSLRALAQAEGADVIRIGVPQEDYGTLMTWRLLEGEGALAVRGPWVASGNSGHREIQLLQVESGERRTLRLAETPAPVTDATMDSLRTLRGLRERMFPGDRWNRYFDRFTELSGQPTEIPLYTDLWLDADARLWVGDYLYSWTEGAAARTAGRVWSVFTLDGTLESRVVLPSHLYRDRVDPILDVQGDRVLVYQRDRATDVSQVAVYRMMPRGG